MIKRVERWHRNILGAASMRCGRCQDDDGNRQETVGVDLVAADGTVFAHGHLSLENAVAFANDFMNAIEELREKTGEVRLQ